MSNWSNSWPEDNIVEEIINIRVKDGQKYKDIPVTIIGDLALDYSDDGWNIYHVPTLQLCSKLVPAYYPATMEFVDGQECYEYEREALLRWMAKVQINYPTAWTMLRCLTPQDYESKGQSAKDIILEWCLSVKVE